MVVGCGSIGAWVTRFLAGSGAENFLLIDPQKVDIENVAPQGFTPIQIGMAKTWALREEIQEISTLITDEKVTCQSCLFKDAHKESNGKADVIFQCTDSMDARKEIFEYAKQIGALYLDGRMAAEAMTLYCWWPGRKFEYEKTLFPQSEASPEPCTARATNYCASNAASNLVALYMAWLRNRPVPHTIKYDFLSFTNEMENDNCWPNGKPG